MKLRRHRSDWVLEPCSRLTISQQIGGLLYDFIEDRQIVFSDGIHKQLLSCIREDTGMCDNTLKKVFLGKSDSMMQYLRILAAIHEWVSAKDFQHLWTTLGGSLDSFLLSNGTAFLAEQRQQQRPIRKTSNIHS